MKAISPERTHFEGYQGSGCIEISAPAASHAVAFYHNIENPIASAACGARRRFGPHE